MAVTMERLDTMLSSYGQPTFDNEVASLRRAVDWLLLEELWVQDQPMTATQLMMTSSDLQPGYIDVAQRLRERRRKPPAISARELSDAVNARNTAESLSLGRSESVRHPGSGVNAAVRFAWERQRVEQALAWVASGKVDLTGSKARCPPLEGLLEELLACLCAPWAESWRSGKDELMRDVMTALDTIDPEGYVLRGRVQRFFLCMRLAGGAATAALAAAGPHISGFLRGASIGDVDALSGRFRPPAGGLVDLELAIMTALQTAFDGADDLWFNARPGDGGAISERPTVHLE
eukprot:TRINITY_DN19493_c0_g1_i2.p1 TRINITY_DN19493_c0_g1~~TRINITY_DN19493_c0_g1_i2.p1  ORF type:complete len:291 (+),score=42.81 TRINITY_DN19493_c0_g1_i2:80-952(+)